MDSIRELSYQSLIRNIHGSNCDIYSSVCIECENEASARSLEAKIQSLSEFNKLHNLNTEIDQSLIRINYYPFDIDLCALISTGSDVIEDPTFHVSSEHDFVQVGICKYLNKEVSGNIHFNMDFECLMEGDNSIYNSIMWFLCSLGAKQSSSGVVEYNQSQAFSFPVKSIRAESNDTRCRSEIPKFENIEYLRRCIGIRRVGSIIDPSKILIQQNTQVNALEVTFVSSEEKMRVNFSFDSEYFTVDSADSLIQEVYSILSTRKRSIIYGCTKHAFSDYNNSDFLRVVKRNALLDLNRTIAKQYNENISWKYIIGQAKSIANAIDRLSSKWNYCGIMIRPSAEFVSAALGVLLSGKTFVPLSCKFGKERISSILNQGDIGIVITDGDEFANDSSLGRYMVSLRECLSNVEYSDDSLCLFDAPIKNSVLYRLHTSGSTGEPKAVDVTTANYMALYDSYDEFLPDFRTLNWAFTGSPVFDSSTKQYLFPLLNNTLIYLPVASIDDDLTKVTEELIINDVNVLNMTPQLIKLAMDSDVDISPYKYVLTGGEALSSDLYNEILNRTGKDNLLNMYGPTEATVNATGHVGKASVCYFDILPIGKPLKHSRVCVVDKNLTIVPKGHRGELLLSGHLLTGGYPNDKEKTKAAFISMNGEQWYRTGDQVVHWFDNDIYFIGRDDGQVKINGVRVEMGEIYSLLSKLPTIDMVDVLLRNNRVYVFYMDKGPDSLQDEKELHKGALSVLPSYVVVAKFVPLDKVPLTIQGKTDRKALEKIVDKLIEVDESIALETILDESELIIYGIISSAMLARMGVGYDVSRSLHEQGVDSLTSIQILVRLQREAGLSAPAISVANAKSLETLKYILSSSRTDITSGWELVRGRHNVVLLFPPVLGDPSIFKNIENSLRCQDTVFVYCTYPGLTQPSDRFRSISSMSESIANELLMNCPQSCQITFVGYSMGCLVAVETAKQVAGKRNIDNVILIDKGPYNSVINNTLELQVNDSIRFLNESLKDGAGADDVVMQELEGFVKHNTNMSYNYEIGDFSIDANALCIKCTKGQESFGDSDWEQYFSSYSVCHIDCSHGDVVRIGWSSRVAQHIESLIYETAV